MCLLSFFGETIMIPNIDLFGRTISPYMLTALAGVLVVLFYAQSLAKKRGLDEIHTLYMLLYGFVGVLLGGSILYGITNLELIVYTLQNLWQIDSFTAFIDRIVLIFGGSVFYGGLIGCVGICLYYLKRKALPLGPYADIGAVCIPLFHFFGRMGCFLSGCCYGVAWEHGIVYHHSPAESANGIPRFPVQLVEAVLNLMLFLLLRHWLKKDRLKNRLLAVYFSVYPVYRFILEYFRGDEYRGFVGIFSTSQFISLLLLAGVAVFWSLTAAKKPTAKPT